MARLERTRDRVPASSTCSDSIVKHSPIPNGPGPKPSVLLGRRMSEMSKHALAKCPADLAPKCWGSRTLGCALDVRRLMDVVGCAVLAAFA